MDPAEALDLAWTALTARRRGDVVDVVEELVKAKAFMRGHAYRFAIAAMYKWIAGFRGRVRVVSRIGDYIVSLYPEQGDIMNCRERLASLLGAVESLWRSNGEFDAGEATALVELEVIRYASRCSVNSPLDIGVVVGVDQGKLFTHMISPLLYGVVSLILNDVKEGRLDSVRALLGFDYHLGEWQGDPGVVRLQGDLAMGVHASLKSWDQAIKLAHIAGAAWRAGSYVVSRLVKNWGRVAAKITLESSLKSPFSAMSSSFSAVAGFTEEVLRSELEEEVVNIVARDLSEPPSRRPFRVELSDAILDVGFSVAPTQVGGERYEIIRIAGWRINEVLEPRSDLSSLFCGAIEGALAEDCKVAEPYEASEALALASNPIFSTAYYLSHVGAAAAASTGVRAGYSIRPIDAFRLAYGTMPVEGGVVSTLYAAEITALAAVRRFEEELKKHDLEPSIVKARVGDHEVELEGIALTGPMQKMFRSFRLFRISATLAWWLDKHNITVERILEKPTSIGRDLRLKIARLLAHLVSTRADPLPAIVAPGSTITARHPEHGVTEVTVDEPLLVELTTLIQPPRPRPWIIREDLEEAMKRMNDDVVEALRTDMEEDLQR